MYLNNMYYKFRDVSDRYLGGYLLLKQSQDNIMHIQASNFMNYIIKKEFIYVDTPPEIVNLKVSNFLMFDLNLCNFMLDCDQVYIVLISLCRLCLVKLLT